MPRVLALAVESSVLERNAPTAEQIDAAFRAASVSQGLYSEADYWGDWVGPAPRITRRAVVGSAFRTYAAWLYEVSDDTPPERWTVIQRLLLDNLREELAKQSSDWSAQLRPYSATLNGSVRWWSTGQAARTATQNEFPTLTGRVDANENPTGPTTPETHPTSTSELATRTASSLGGLATKLLPWAVGAGVLWFLWQSGALAFGRPKAKPRYAENPRPKIWDHSPPSSPYACPGQAYTGVAVPGKGGGTISGCATPSRKRPAEGQYWIGALTGKGRPIRKVTARHRIHRTRQLVPGDPVLTAAMVDAYEQTGLAAPQGLEFDHLRGSSPCDPDHRTWAGYEDALQDARERASVYGDSLDAEDYARLVAQTLAESPKGSAWTKTASTCAKQYKQRQSAKQKATFSTAREAARKRSEALQQGMDTGSAEYRDTLRGGEGSRRRKRK